MKLLPDEILQALLAYLSQRPYREVAQAMQALAQLQDAPPPPDPEICKPA